MIFDRKIAMQFAAKFGFLNKALNVSITNNL